MSQARGTFFLPFSLLIFSLLLTFLPSCFSGGTESQKEKGLVVINVLDKKLYDDCHIAGSICVPFMEVQKYALKHIDKDAEIILYCSNYLCTSSIVNRKQLLNLGYKNVWVYKGGTAEWHQRGYPVNGPCQSSYLKKELSPPAEKESYVIDIEILKKKLDEKR